MKALNDGVVRKWASDWADAYDQKISDEELRELVGKTVDGEAEDSEGNPKGFKAMSVVGFSTDKIFFQNEDEEDSEVLFVVRRSIVTLDGKQIPILAGMTITEASLDNEG